MSGRMLLPCDYTVVLPLQLTFIYPNMWKLANVTPIFKKGDKQLIKNYRSISLLSICGKILEKIIINNLYNHRNYKFSDKKNQAGFRLGDSTTNQLLYRINEIHQAFGSLYKSVQYFWTFPRPFVRCGTMDSLVTY